MPLEGNQYIVRARHVVTAGSSAASRLLAAVGVPTAAPMPADNLAPEDVNSNEAANVGLRPSNVFARFNSLRTVRITERKNPPLTRGILFKTCDRPAACS